MRWACYDGAQKKRSQWGLIAPQRIESSNSSLDGRRGMTGKIFINYRRGDEPGFTQALLGRLEQAFPAERLFIDVDNIPPGEDFVRMLESQVAECDAMLAIIGNGWLDATDERGNRRLHDPNDFVRVEIESALRQGKRVIPVLVHEARMPRSDELPEAIRSLATRNAVRLTHERFRADVQGLIRALQGALDEVVTRRPRSGRDAKRRLEHSKRPRWLLGILLGLCAVGVVVIGSILALNLHPTTTRQATLVPNSTQPTSPQLTTVQPSPPQPGNSAQALPSRSAPAQSTPTKVQEGAPTKAASKPVPQSGGTTVASANPNTANVEVIFWNSIKDQKNVSLFEAYLKRYPNGAFADIARITLNELKMAPPLLPTQQSDDSLPITDPTLLHDLRDRLYELNFDPGPIDGPVTEATHAAIKEFQQQRNLPATGIATMGLLKQLRTIGGVKPWGAIVFDKDHEKWGMAWNESTRTAAVAHARASCGDANSCPVEISFFGTDCGAFAHSTAGWSIVAREDITKAKEQALGDCLKRGKSCQIIAAVCADGAQRFTAN